MYIARGLKEWHGSSVDDTVRRPGYQDEDNLGMLHHVGRVIYLVHIPSGSPRDPSYEPVPY